MQSRRSQARCGSTDRGIDGSGAETTGECENIRLTLVLLDFGQQPLQSREVLVVVAADLPGESLARERDYAGADPVAVLRGTGIRSVLRHSRTVAALCPDGHPPRERMRCRIASLSASASPQRRCTPARRA